MEPGLMSANEDEMTTERASAKLRAGECVPAAFAPGANCSGAETTAAEDPIARVQEELALLISPRMRDVLAIITAASLIDLTVLITGETGTGKEVVARAIHYLSGRQNGRFVLVNCAAVARDLLENELFGHERGAFSGAYQLQVGKFEAADRGTIFLDEIGDLHPALQAKLLHVLEDGQFFRAGGRSSLKVDVRVVAATNQDLEAAVGAGTFREDLFYRLNVIRIVVPPLRERVEEIPVLADYFVRRYTRLFQQPSLTLPDDTLQRLQAHRFPGNVRELENMIKRMVLLRDLGVGGATTTQDNRTAASSSTAAAGSLRTISRRAALAAEQSAILQALEETRWNRLRAAKLLNISYRSLLHKIKEAGLDAGRPATDLS